MKKMSRQILAALGCGALTCIGVTPITSCSLESTADEIVFASYTLNTTSSFVTIPFTSTVITNATAHIEIENETTGKILLDAKEIQIEDGHGQIQLNVNETANATFTFTLIVSFPSILGKKTIKSRYFTLYYTHDPHVDEDEVIMPITAIRKVSEYDFSFEIRFRQRPLSSVLVNLGDKSGLLSFEEWGNAAVTELNVEPESRDNYFVIQFNIYLKFCVFTSSTFLFDIDISFLNTKSIIQENKFADNSVTMTHLTTAEIPKFYYDIQNSVLKGIKKEVPKDIINSYCIMNIPEGVERIESVVHEGKVKYEGKIQQIILPKSLKGTTTNCFEKFENLSCIDTSNLNIDAEPGLLATHTFARRINIQLVIILPDYRSGVWDLWISWWNYEISSDKIYVKTQDVTPPELFVIKSDTGSRKGKIVRINDDGNLQNYRVVRIPWIIDKINIVGIGTNVFEIFSKKPYIVNNLLTHRRLLLHDNLESIECPLTRFGINSEIMWPRKINSFPENCFFEAHRYSDEAEKLGLSYEMDDLHSYLRHDSIIKNIAPGAFASSYYIWYYFNEGSYNYQQLEEIGDAAFSRRDVEKHIGGVSPKLDWINSRPIKPKSWKKVGSQIFGGWHNVLEFDFSEFNDIPEWMIGTEEEPAPSDIFADVSFADKQDEKNGTIWIKNIGGTEDEQKAWINKWVEKLGEVGFEKVISEKDEKQDGYYIVTIKK